MGYGNERQLLHHREVEGTSGLGPSSPPRRTRKGTRGSLESQGGLGVSPLPSASTDPGAHGTVESGRERQAVTAPNRPGVPGGVDPLLSVRAVSAWVGVSPSTIRRWVRAGAMPAPIVLGGHGGEGNPQTHRWPQSEIQAWLDGCRGDASVASRVGP